MNAPLRILMLARGASGAEKILSQLASQGTAVCFAQRVGTRSELGAALRTGRFDLVLSDSSVPEINSVSALRLIHRKLPGTPFLLLADTVKEQLAIAMLKSGAAGASPADRLVRLAPAIARAMKAAQACPAQDAGAKFTLLWNRVGSAVAIADMEGNFTQVNPAFRKLLRLGSQDVAGLCLPPLAHERTPALRNAIGALLTGRLQSWKFRQEFHRIGGGLVAAEISVSLFGQPGATGPALLCLFEDATERQVTQDRLREAEKAEVIGRLTAGFVHDFNNILTLIVGYCGSLLERPGLDEVVRSELSEIMRAGERAGVLTRRLLSYSRRQGPQKVRLNVNAVVGGIEQTLRQFLTPEIPLVLQFTDGLDLIEGDQLQLELIITNLAINGRDAMPGGGCLTIQTANTQVDGALARSLDVSPGHYVLITVSDTGHGIDDATKSRIFEPYFTTKPEGHGTGLGLWMANEAVRRGGGAIDMKSEKGRGSAFHIYLPSRSRAVIPKSRVAPLAPHAAGPRGSETVLLVEADRQAYLLAFEALTRSGYRVLGARDAVQAFVVAGREPGDIHLLLMTDIESPGMNNRVAARGLTIRRRGMKTIFISGDEGKRALPPSGGEAAAILCRPFTANSLLHCVRRALDAPPLARILVVDDDPAIRAYLHAVLQGAGYHVVEASDGRAAVDRLHEGVIDLLFTDLVMPGQEGMETIIAVGKEFPQLPVVAMSGRFGSQFLNMARALGARATIEKPFRPETVLDVARRLLTRKN